MALVVLLRGVNVGGHRTLRPTLIAQALRAYDVVNIGAAGTFVVRKPTPRAGLRAALRKRLPADTQFVFCEGRDLIQLCADASLETTSPEAGLVRFVSFFVKPGRVRAPLPLTLPRDGDWYVRVNTLTTRIAVGEYRRHMKTIGYLGQLDALLGGAVTTRNWNTVKAILRVLTAGARSPQRAIARRSP